MINWKNHVRRFLKAELYREDITHDKLLKLLNYMGIEETKASIDNKISRGTFSAIFLFQCLSAIKANSARLKDYTIDHSVISEINEPSTPYQYGLFDQNDNGLYLHSQTNISYLDISCDTVNNHIIRNNKVISLFSGAGGFDIGIESAGFETAVCVEIDRDCRETIRFNKPNWQLLENSSNRIPGDIRAIKPKEILKLSGLKKNEAALVIGGAPCQPFSNIGNKKGKEDPENGDLFVEFVRMVKGISPKAFIFENVVGITQSRHSDIIKYMMKKFKGLGYGISFSVLNSADYGVGQTRKRFFLIGIKNVKNPSFPLPTHFKNLDDWNKFTNGFGLKPRFVPKAWITLGEVFNNISKNSTERDDYVIMNISKQVEKRMKLIGPGQNFKVLPLNMRPNCWRNGKHQGQDTFGRLKLNKPSVTIRTASYNPSKGRYIHPTENRGLNSAEMASIQGFPHNWTFKCLGRKKVTLVSVGKQIGNAVPPPLAQALGVSMRLQLENNS